MSESLLHLVDHGMTSLLCKFAKENDTIFDVGLWILLFYILSTSLIIKEKLLALEFFTHVYFLYLFSLCGAKPLVLGRLHDLQEFSFFFFMSFNDTIHSVTPNMLTQLLTNSASKWSTSEYSTAISLVFYWRKILYWCNSFLIDMIPSL